MSQQNDQEMQNFDRNDGTVISGADEMNRDSEYIYSSNSNQNGSSYYSKRYKLLDFFLLKDSNGQKSINKVCCIPIKKNWTIRKQMIISLMVLSCSVFLLVILIVIGNLMLTKYLIKKSSEDAIHQQIQENLRNSAKEYSNAILEIFHGSSSKLEILTRIVLSAMKEDNQIFDFDYVKEFPIIGKEDYADLTGVKDADLDKSEEVKNDYGKYKVTFKYWQWGSYDQIHSITKKENLTPDSQKILGACDVLNYFLEDFFFDKNVTYIHYIYMVFVNLDTTKKTVPAAQQDIFSIWYPGGINTDFYPASQIVGADKSSAYDPTLSLWYTQTKKNFEQGSGSVMILTGPYLDADTKMKTLTISKAIMNQDNVFRGVASIDMLVNDLQTIIDRVKFYETGFLMLVNQKNGEILNDPYNSQTIYHIFDTDLTKFTESQWIEIISNKKDYAEDEIINITNTDDEQILIMRNFIDGQIQGENYILIVQVPEKEAYHFLYDLSTKMFETFQTIQVITVCTILFTCSIAILCGCCYSDRIVKPLTKLTEYAKSINSNATKKSLTQDIKIDLDEIKASDKIGELIDAFKNLVKGLSGLKKGARTEMAAGNEKINFPINFYYGTKMKWRHLLEYLKNQEEKKNNEKGNDKFPEKPQQVDPNSDVINRRSSEQQNKTAGQDSSPKGNRKGSEELKAENIKIQGLEDNRSGRGQSNSNIGVEKIKKMDEGLESDLFGNIQNKQKTD